jgi:hypothetical protein
MGDVWSESRFCVVKDSGWMEPSAARCGSLVPSMDAKAMTR